MEVRDGVAAVFREDGAVVKLRQSCRVGDTVDLPELPQESARNAWQKVSALGAKLTEFPSRLKHGTDEPAPDTTEIISPDAADFGATAVISDTVREALDTETEIISDETPTTKITLDKPPVTTDEPSATFDVFGAVPTPEVTFDKPPANEPTFDATESISGAFDAPPADFAPPREVEADITSGTVWDIPDAPRDVASVISDTVDAPKQSRKRRKAPLFPVGLHVLDTIKERVKPAGDSETKPKSSKKGWWQDSRVRAGIAAALAVAILSGSVMYNTAMACAYVALDVDESAFEFSVNRMGRVIAVNAISPDARGLAQSLQGGVKNKTVDEAVTYTMGVLRDAGYLEDAKGEIIASVTSNAEKRSMELTQTVAQSVEGNKQNGVKLYLMEASRNDRGAALARQLSPGRYLIQRSGDLLRPTIDTGASAETLDAPDTPAVPDTPDTPDMSAVEGLPTVSGAAAQPERQLRPVLGTGSGAASGTVTAPGTLTSTTSGTPATTTPGTSATTTPGTPATTTPGTSTTTTPRTSTTTTPRTSTTTTPKTSTTTTPKTSTTTTPRTSTTPTTPKSDTGSTTKKSSNSRTTDSGKTTATPKTAPQPEPVTPAPQPTPVQPEPIAQPEPEPAPDITPAPEPEPEPESQPTPRQVEPEPEPESQPAPRHSEPEPEQLWSNDTPARKPAEPSGNDGGETVAPKRDSGETTKSEPRDNGETVQASKLDKPDTSEAPSPAHSDGGDTVQASKPDKPDTSEAPSPAHSDGGDTVAPKPSQPEPEPEAVAPPPANDGDGELYTPDET